MAALNVAQVFDSNAKDARRTEFVIVSAMDRNVIFQVMTTELGLRTSFRTTDMIL